MNTSSHIVIIASWFIVISLGIFGLLVTKEFITPLVIALFFAFFLYPATKKLERIIPRIASIILLLFLAILFLGGIITILSLAFRQIVSDLPTIQANFFQNIDMISTWIEKVFSFSGQEQIVFIKEQVNLGALAAKNVPQLFSATTGFGVQLSLVFVYTFFILLYRDKIKFFFISLFKTDNKHKALEITKKIIGIIPKYLTGLLNLVVAVSFLSWIGFLIIGLDNALFFALLTGFLNVIPYAGPFIAFSIILVFALTTQGLNIVIGSLIIFACIQFLENNILVPWITGSHIDINALAAILAIVIGGALWGVFGMIIALPLLGMVKVVCDSLPELHAVSQLIGNKKITH